MLLSHFSRVQRCATPKTGAHQAPPSLGFSRQEPWSGQPFPSSMHESEKWKWSRSVVSDSSRPHGLQPTRLLRSWDFPGKSTGVGCHCLLLYLYIIMSTPRVYNNMKRITHNLNSNFEAIHKNPNDEWSSLIEKYIRRRWNWERTTDTPFLFYFVFIFLYKNTIYIIMNFQKWRAVTVNKKRQSFIASEG